MPQILLRAFYHDRRVLPRVSVVWLGATPIDGYIVQGENHCIKNASFEIRNDLPFPIFVEAIEGRLGHYDSPFVRNLFLPVRLKVGAHGRAQVSWEYDLPHNLHLEGRAAESTLPVQLKGRMAFTAIGEHFVAPLNLSMTLCIHKQWT